MDISRNQYFMAGVVFLLLGIQFRVVDSYTLNPDTTRVLARRSAAKQEAVTQQTAFFVSQAPSTAQLTKTIRPPEWLGWCLGSVGMVLIMHSLAMKRPD